MRLAIIGASAASPYLINPTSTLSVYMSWTGSILASKDDALYRVDCYVHVAKIKKPLSAQHATVSCQRLLNQAEPLN